MTSSDIKQPISQVKSKLSKMNLGVALESLDAGLVLVIPDLDHPVVRAADEVRLVAAVVVVDAVDAFLVPVQREVWRVGPKLPDLQSDED